MTDVGAKTGINLKTIGKIKLLSLPVAEQKTIATALSNVDALLDALERLTAKKRDLKQAAMQQLLRAKPASLASAASGNRNHSTR